MKGRVCGTMNEGGVTFSGDDSNSGPFCHTAMIYL
jgi:hypothetical protein